LSVFDIFRISSTIGFLPARKRGTCYGNGSGWVAGCHTPVLYQNG